MAFDIEAARNEGYSDQEIAAFLAKVSPNFNVEGALGEGYTLEEISNALKAPKKQTKELEPPKGPLASMTDVPSKLGRAAGVVAGRAAEAGIPLMPGQVADTSKLLTRGRQLGQVPQEAVQAASGEEGLNPEARTYAKEGEYAADALSFLGQPPVAQGAKVAGNLTRGIGSKAFNIVKTLFKPGKEASKIKARDIVNPLKKELQSLKEGSPQRRAIERVIETLKKTKQGVDNTFPLVKKELLSQKEEFGAKIQKIEENLGIGLSTKQTDYIRKVIGNSKLKRRAIKQLESMSKMGAEKLKSGLSKETIQAQKKLAETLTKKGNLTDLENAIVSRASKELGNAIPETVQMRENIGRIYKALDDLPKSYKNKVRSIKNNLKQYQSKLSDRKSIDKEKMNILKKELRNEEEKASELILDGMKADLYRKRLAYALFGAGLGKAVLSLGGE